MGWQDSFQPEPVAPARNVPMGNWPIDKQRKATLEIFGDGAQQPSWMESFQPDAPALTIRPDQIPQMPADAVSYEQANPDFYQRVGQRMLERGQNVAGDVVRTATGQNSIPETMLNYLSNSAGLLWDVGAEGAKSAFNALPSVAQEGIKATPSFLAQSPLVSSSLTAGKELVTQASERGGQLAKQYPDTARRYSNLVEAGFNLSGLPVAGKAAEATANVVKPIAEVTADRIAPVLQKAKPAAKLEPLNQDIVRQAGSNAYKYVKDTGTTFSPQGVNRILDVLESKRQKGSFGGKVITKEQAAINEAIDEFMPARGSVGTIDDIQTLDSQLGDKAAMAYTSGDFNKGRIFSNLQDDVRNALRKENTKVGDIIGSREGVDVLMNDAIPLWATQAKLGDIQKIIDRANVMDNPTTAIRTGFRNLMLNKNKFKQYPKEVQAMIKDAADTGAIDDLMGIIGSRLNPIIGLAGGGVKQAIVNNVVSKGARSVRDKMRMNKVNKIIEEMVKDVRPSVERFRNMPEAPKEPTRLLEYQPKPVDFIADTQGRAAPVQSTPQQAIAGVKAISGRENLIRENVPGSIAEQMASRAQEAANREAFARNAFNPQGRPLALPAPNIATDIQAGALGARKLTVAEQLALNARRANKESLGGRIDRITPEQRKLLAGIQRGNNGVARVTPQVEKPLLQTAAPQVGKTIEKKAPRIAPKEFNDSGKPTSLYTFIRNNGGVMDVGGNLKSMGHLDLINNKNGIHGDSLGEKLLEYGFFDKRPTTAQVLKLIEDTNGGRSAYAPKDINRVMKAQENAAAKQLNDPDYIEYTASNIGIDTQGKTTQQLLKAIEAEQKKLDDIPFDMPEGGKLKSFLKDESGSVGRAVTDTPEFKRWFGDSKVVDAEGKPLVVYHGTDKNFQSFNPKKGAQQIVWFTSDKAAIEAGEVGAAGKGRIIDMYVNIKNPAGWREYDNLTLNELEARGYDGVILPNKDGSITGFAFEPTQFKSVKNKGFWNPSDKRLLYNFGGTGAAIPLGAAGAGATYYQNQPK